MGYWGKGKGKGKGQQWKRTNSRNPYVLRSQAVCMLQLAVLSFSQQEVEVEDEVGRGDCKGGFDNIDERFSTLDSQEWEVGMC